MTVSLGPSRRVVGSPHYKWWAYACIGIGMFLTVMDQTGVNIALPRIADRFAADIPTVQWITLGYVLSTSVTLMPMGRLSDMVGRKRVYTLGFVVFICAASLGGSAGRFVVLMVAKIIQGIGAAGIQANGMAIVIGVFPERERGRAVGLYMAIIGIGSISGPIVGGLLVSGLGWRSVFFASVPVGLMALVAAMAVLKAGRPARDPGAGQISFDWAGASLSAAALTAFLLAMTNGYRIGWTSPPIFTGLALAVALLGAFLWWELRASDPMLDLGFFKSRTFSLGVFARFLSFLSGSSVYFLMPFYLMQGLGYPASQAGLMMVPGSVCMAVFGPISGRISDTVGTRWLTVAGMAMSASALFTFSRLSVDSPPIHVIIGMMLSGAGMGTFSAANTSATLSPMSREKYGIVSAFLNVGRTSANVTGIAVATTTVTLTMGALGYEPSLSAVSDAGGQGARAAFVAGLDKAFLIAAGFALTALVASAWRGETAPSGSSASELAGLSRQQPNTGREE